jgi:hypothetical protein
MGIKYERLNIDGSPVTVGVGAARWQRQFRD